MSGGQTAELRDRAAALLKQGRHAEAETLLRQILAAAPTDMPARHCLGILCAQQSRFLEALAILQSALCANPDDAAIALDIGKVHAASGQLEQAIGAFEHCISLRPAYPEAWIQKGIALRARNAPEAALQSFLKALEIRPHDLVATIHCALTMVAAGDLNRALAFYDSAVLLADDHADLWNDRGKVLIRLSRHDEAIASFGRALARKPDHVGALLNSGVALLEMRRAEEALDFHDKAMAIDSRHAAVLFHRGNALRHLGRADEALDHYDRCLAQTPDNADAWINRGVVLHHLRRLVEAIASYDKALALSPQNVTAMCNRAITLWDMGQFRQAQEMQRQALRLAPQSELAFQGVTYAALHTCDWAEAAALLPQIKRRVQAGRNDILPFVLLGYSDDPALQLSCAKNHARSIGHNPRPFWKGTPYGHAKIRVAYLSADFRQHPMTACIAQLLELHDRSRFEVTAISIGPDDASPNRERIIQAVDRFLDAWPLTDRRAAELIRQHEIDILVDLNGYTQHARPGILAHRPAPVQVGYMGFPATQGSPVIDYLVADAIVVPDGSDRYYDEQIVRLPASYWVNDGRREVGTPLTRADVGLAEDAFVFCCFNSNWKITAPIFDVWMHLLARVPGSVLWLLDGNELARRNMEQQAERLGMGQGRLVFAQRTDPATHLERLPLADLMLDTLPYNAHTTAFEALWRGVPLVTCAGNAFAARVAASLLHAAGLPELVTSSLQEYQALALRLASDRPFLATIRQTLATNRTTAPLFDTDLFRRNLEKEYLRMLAKTGLV